jgi:hypothetical protein
MTKRKWKLTRDGEVDEWGDQQRQADRPASSPTSLIAEAQRGRLLMLSPGVYIGPKAP